jgi:peptide deformylase
MTPPSAHSRPILQVGDPRLQRVAAPIADPADPGLQFLIEELITLMQARNGVGIAAPQVGIAQRLIILASRPTPRYPQAPLMDPIALLNPEIVATSDALEKGWEGCLSVGNQRAEVWRAQAVEVTYLDRQGHPQRRTWEGFIARIVQHEIDHLDGKVFLERVAPEDPIVDEVTFLQRIGGNGSASRSPVDPD